MNDAIASEPILLYNDECAVCRTIARWVMRSARRANGTSSLDVRPIGDDPFALRALRADLDIWEAYEIVHVLMPDGSTKRGGEAVAEVLRALPSCAWFAWTFQRAIFGVRPFELVLNLGYTVLADARPLFGCESCGIPSPWVRAVQSALKREHSKPRRAAGLSGSHVSLHVPRA